MLIEAIKHFFLKAPKDIKDLGFGREAIAILSRYKRCKHHWDPHLKATKSELINIIKKNGSGKNVVLLGSGSLLDIPISEISKIVKTLTLVDIIHLPEALAQTAPFGNIQHKNMDVTNFVTPFMDWAKDKDGSSQPRPQKPDFYQFNGDLMVSLNLISQLALPFKDYISRKKLILLPDNFEKNLINLHLGALKKTAPKTWVIGDISRNYFKGNKLLKTENLPIGLNLPSLHNSWNWDIAPKGEVDLKMSIQHKVGVWDLSQS